MYKICSECMSLIYLMRFTRKNPSTNVWKSPKKKIWLLSNVFLGYCYGHPKGIYSAYWTTGVVRISKLFLRRFIISFIRNKYGDGSGTSRLSWGNFQSEKFNSNIICNCSSEDDAEVGSNRSKNWTTIANKCQYN